MHRYRQVYIRLNRMHRYMDKFIFGCIGCIDTEKFIFGCIGCIDTDKFIFGCIECIDTDKFIFCCIGYIDTDKFIYGCKGCINTDKFIFDWILLELINFTNRKNYIFSFSLQIQIEKEQLTVTKYLFKKTKKNVFKKNVFLSYCFCLFLLKS